MKKKDINIIALIVTFVIFGISIGLSILYIFNLQESNSEYFNSYNIDEVNKLSEILKQQSETNRTLEKIVKEKIYTFDNPYVEINPYKINPLSAVIAFNTKGNESIEVYINDEFAYSVKETKEHLIPIYGLYNNAVNIITLKMGTKSKELEIKTDLYNFDHEGIEIADYLNDKSHYFLLGDMKKKDSNLRGFDDLGNLIYYLDLEYISGVKFYNTRLFVSYNSKYSKDNKLKDIKLEMDYLGKIYSISTNLSDLDTNNNIDNGNNDIYVGTSVNIYRENISNIDLSSMQDNLKYTNYTKVSTKEIASKLESAEIYDGEYKISSNGEYLTYDIDSDGILVMVNKNTFYSYMYTLDDTHMIKIEPLGQSALYLYKDGTYYTLLTTVTK